MRDPQCIYIDAKMKMSDSKQNKVRRRTSRNPREDELSLLKREMQKRTEALKLQINELHQSKALLSAIIDNDPDAIITSDHNGTIKSFNPAAQRIFGYAADEVIGKDVSLLMPPPHRESHPGHIDRYTATHETHIMGRRREVIGLRKDGTVFPLEISIGEVDHLAIFIGIARDISEQRALERRIVDLASLEQERIGREIHDGLGQRLTALTLMARSLAKNLGDKDKLAADKVRTFVEELQIANNEAHDLALGLAPVPIDPEGLESALIQLGNRTEVITGHACRVKVDKSVRVDDRSISAQLYRIAQEAIHNAVKHAQAQTITIKLSRNGGNGSIDLIIADDGKGFDPNKNKDFTLGLQIMQYRANAIGAVLQINSAKGKGTVVRCTMP